MKKLLICLILLNAITIINAQTIQKKPIKAPIKVANKVQTKIIKSTPFLPFNINATSLPASFSGIDIQRVYENLDNRNESNTKGEYETTAHFNKRIDSLSKTSIINKLTIDSLFYFQGILDERDNNLNYDADNESFSILNRGLNSSFSGSIKNVYEKYGYTHISGVHSIVLQKVIKDLDKYEASNAYGKKVVVEKTQFDSYNVIENNDNNLFLDGYSLNFKATPDLAKKYKENGYLKLLVIGKLIPPYIHQHYDNTKPTIDNPNEFISYDNYVYMNVQELWIYDKSSGIIYAKIKRK